MAVRKILKDGEPNLRKKSKPVTEFNERLWTLFDDLKDTLKSVQGLGLAAPQVNVLRRAVIVCLDGEHVEMANPQVLLSEGELLDNEGCLSVGYCRGMVKRPAKVTVSYFDRNGNKCEITRENYQARCILHEIDHLDGILFVDKMVKRVEINNK